MGKLEIIFISLIATPIALTAIALCWFGFFVLLRAIWKWWKTNK